MNYIELSSENAEKDTLRLAEMISGSYSPDAVVFVSKGAYKIGAELGKYFDVPVLEIFAERKMNALKQLCSPFLRLIPSKLKHKLRSMEVSGNSHKKNSERKVHWGKIPQNAENADFRRILLADDSCDTGSTFVQCAEEIKKRYPSAEIKTAALNVFSDSENIIHTDFCIYRDCLISGPWSNDSAEHKDFLKGYNRYISEK